ncbi:TonB-dependent receptor [Flavivirga amylovorans]
MKLTTVLLFISVFSINANTHSQNTKITCNLKNVRITDVFEKIEKDTEYKFLFDNDEVNTAKIVSLKVKNKPLKKVLQDLFLGTDISFKVRNKQIILLIDENKAVSDSNTIPKETKEVQQVDIRGIIKDTKGFPLPGANVLVKGTSIGTVSNFDGEYILKNVPENATTLVCSYLGYKTTEVAINGRTAIDISLEEDAAALDEVVVVGYGTQRKSDLTGAVASVSAATIAEQPSLRIEESLQGKVAGVQIQRTSGAPDGTLRVRIRGTNSIQGDNSPLYVVDGFLGADMSSINVNDIQSIEVLKDASATAVFGARGSNGVILITTKSAKVGKTSWGFNSKLGFDSLIEEVDRATPYQFTQIVNLSNPNSYSQAEQQEFLDDPSKGTDWFDEVFRTGLNRNYQLFAQGGSERMKFYVSGSYDDIEAIVKNDDYKRYVLRANLNFNLGDKSKLTLNTNASRIDRNRSGVGIRDPYFYAPVTEILDEFGEYTDPSSFGSPTTLHPTYSVNERRTLTKTNIISALARLDLEPIKNITYSLTGTIQNRSINRSGFNRYLPGEDPSLSTAEVGNREVLSWQITNQLNYNNTFGDHSITLTGVQEMQSREETATLVEFTNFTSISQGFNNLGAANSSIASSNPLDNEARTIVSFVGRLNYSFKDKYLLTTAFRADASSVFGVNNKWAYFPSMALAWKVSNEGFLSDSETIDALKLRVSYGQVGSQAIAPYNSFGALKIPDIGTPINNGTIGGAIGLDTPGNPDLKWETTSQFDFGFDLEMFQRRLTVGADIYYKKTTDLLYSRALPFYLGTPSGLQLQNVGSMENKGLELLVSGDVVRNDNFRFNVAANLSINRNKFLGIDGIDSDIPVLSEQYQSNSFAGIVPFVLIKGQPLGTIQGLIYEGPYRTEDAALAAQHGYDLGAPRFRDISGPDGVPDGLITTDDVTVIGNGQPDYTLGINMNMDYKNFDLTLFVQSVQGNDILNIDRYQQTRVFTNPELLTAWSPTNESSNHWTYASSSFSNPGNTQYIEDGSFVRLKNVTLGYTLPKDFTEKMGIESLRFYFNAQNVITITDYSGWDPEATSTENRDQSQGVNLGAYPNPKSFSLGLNLKI